jgi:hypothetical protein
MRKTSSKTKPRATPKPAKVQPISAPVEVEAPDWVNVTPDDNSYGLTMWEGGGGNEQEIDITRDEFIRLKRFLAALRDYELSMTPINAIQVGKITSLDSIEITQDEAQMLMDFEYAVDRLFLNFRKRLKDGACIEEGKWKISDEEAENIEFYKERVSGSRRCGLLIDSAEVAASA